MYKVAKSLNFSVPDDFSILVNASMPISSNQVPEFTKTSRDLDGYMSALMKIINKIRRGETAGTIRVPGYIEEYGSVRDISSTAEPLKIDLTSFFKGGSGMNFHTQKLLEDLTDRES